MKQVKNWLVRVPSSVDPTEYFVVRGTRPKIMDGCLMILWETPDISVAHWIFATNSWVWVKEAVPADLQMVIDRRAELEVS